jgi:Concanavalin A-like lectin/glucanases superfamily/Domain of unknown function (DUF6531)
VVHAAGVPVFAVAAMVLLGVALTAVASQPNDDLSVVEKGGPKPPGFDPSTMIPMADGRGVDQVMAAIDDAKDEAKRTERRLASPESKAERERSKTEFLGASDKAAEAIAEAQFSDELAGAKAALGLDGLSEGRAVSEVVDDHTAILRGDESHPPALVESPWPVRAVDDDGRKRLIDLSLDRQADDFVPANAATDLVLPGELSRGLEVGPVQVTPAGAAAGELSGDGDERVIYPNAQIDTDVLAKAVPTGAEVFWQLRSPRSPEELHLDLDLPEGAVAERTETGQVVIVRDGRRMTSVSAPVATDAQGQGVPAEIAVTAGRLTVAVPHRASDVAYPILVDPVIEDYWDTGGLGLGSWYDQNPIALEGVWHWYHTYNGVPENTYAPRLDCYEVVSCDAAIGHPEYDYWQGDGLHMYVRPATSYPAGSAAWWIYQAPGTTTRIETASLYSFFHRRNGSSSPWMVHGIWNSQGWVGQPGTYDQDHAYTTITHSGGASYPGVQSLAFGFWAPSAANNPNWRDGYIGAAGISMTDPEDPAINGGALKRFEVGEEEGAAGTWVDRDSATKWVAPQDTLAVKPNITDPGLGVRKAKITGSGIADDEVDIGCVGNKFEPCPASWPTDNGYLLEFSPKNLPDGANTLTLHAWDALLKGMTGPFTIKVDSQVPEIATPTGSLWVNQADTNLDPEDQAVLSPGTHDLHVSASDPPRPGANPPTRSGVEKLEVKVDGKTEYSVEQACPAGNCSRTLDWTYDTAAFGGRHTVQVVATDGAGNTSRKTFVVNAPGTGELLSPADDEVTSSRIALQAKDNDDDFTGVKFQYRKRPLGLWNTISTNLTTDQGLPVAQEVQPLTEPGRKTQKLIWDVRTALNALTPKATKIQVRALFVGGPQDFGSRVANVDLDEKGLSADNAQAPIGPGSVDLLTGNFSYTATDATLPNYGAPINITRTFNSRDASANPYGPFGAGWVTSAPVAGVSEYNSLVVLGDGTVDTFDAAGLRARFEKTGDTTFKSPPGYESIALARVPLTGQPDQYTITDLDGVVTTFEKQAGTEKWVPVKVKQPGATGAASFYYDEYQGQPRLKRIVAPAKPDPGLVCNATTLQRGCGALDLTYTDFSGYSHVASIAHTAWDPATSAMNSETVVSYSYTPHVGGLRMTGAWDLRLGSTPQIGEEYTYNDLQGRITSIEPRNEQPWAIAYNVTPFMGPDYDKLASVSRQTASGTEAYEMAWRIPVSGQGAPHQMAATDIDDWGQTDRPLDATAIIPSNFPGTGQMSRATISYLNHDARVVNVIAPGGAVSTSEYDPKGNAVRELSAANRAKALAAGGGSATLAGLLDTRRTFSSDGLRLLEELGPQHEVKLDSGDVVEARPHTVTTYDEGLATNEKRRHLPTTVTTGAQVDPSEPDEDVRVSKTEYDWTLRKPTRTIVDATSGGLNIARQTSYNVDGLVVESRQPKSNGADAGTTKTIYYGDASDADCSGHIEWFNLPCKTKPAAQPGTAGLPDLPVTTYEYNRRLQVTAATEQVGTASRTTTTTYDAAGRKQTEGVTTGGGSGPPGLVAAYGFEEGTGSTVADLSGSGNSGSISGASWSTSGKYGNALDFDGSNDKVTVPDSDSLDLTDGMTLSAWVKPDATTGWRTVLMKEQPSSLSYALYGRTIYTANSGKPSVELHGNGHLLGPSVLPTGTWTHLAATFDVDNDASLRQRRRGRQPVRRRSAADKLEPAVDRRQQRLGRVLQWPHRRGQDLQPRVDRAGDRRRSRPCRVRPDPEAARRAGLHRHLRLRPEHGQADDGLQHERDDHHRLRRRRTRDQLHRRRRRDLDDQLRQLRPAGHDRRRQGNPDPHLRLHHRPADIHGRLPRRHLHGLLRPRRPDRIEGLSQRHDRRHHLRPRRLADPPQVHQDHQLLQQLRLDRRAGLRVDPRPMAHPQLGALQSGVQLRQGRTSDEGRGRRRLARSRGRLHDPQLHLRRQLQPRLDGDAGAGCERRLPAGRDGDDKGLQLRLSRPSHRHGADVRQVRPHDQHPGRALRRRSPQLHLLRQRPGSDDQPGRRREDLRPRPDRSPAPNRRRRRHYLHRDVPLPGRIRLTSLDDYHQRPSSRNLGAQHRGHRWRPRCHQDTQHPRRYHRPPTPEPPWRHHRHLLHRPKFDCSHRSL